MAKLKVYAANIGFYEVAVAARSQKMALAHWGMERERTLIKTLGSRKKSAAPTAKKAIPRKSAGKRKR